MTKERIQTSGVYDAAEDEYSLTFSGSGLVVTFDFLNKEDIEELISCLNCMLIEDAE